MGIQYKTAQYSSYEYFNISQRWITQTKHVKIIILEKYLHFMSPKLENEG